MEILLKGTSLPHQLIKLSLFLFFIIIFPNILYLVMLELSCIFCNLLDEFFELIIKYGNFFEISFINCLVYFPPCITILFINNNHICSQCHKICRCFLVSFVISCNMNWLFRKVNGILGFFPGKYSGRTLAY